MKSILVKLIVVISIIYSFGINYTGYTYAEGKNTGSGITVKVTEKVPGANCTELKKDEQDPEKVTGYECIVAKGFSSVTEMLGKIIKYFTFIAALGGVLFIIINGILYSMGGIDQSLKDESKKRIVGTLIGLVLLMLSGVILNLIAPWIYK